MSQFGKFHLLGAVTLIAGVYWFNHSHKPAVISNDSVAADTVLNSQNSARKSHTPSMTQSPSGTVALSPSAQPVTLPRTQFSPRLERQVNYVAMMLSRPDVALPPEASKADHLTSEEIQQLGSAVIDMNQNHSVRRASIYLLSKAGAKAIPALGTIVMTNFKASAQETETPLRVTALESLDRLTDNSKEVLPILEKTIDVQQNKTLTFLASISAGGIRHGKPGKLTRAINMMIQEKLASKDNGQ
ncbi:hypothetical protein [Bdellovibrio sp. KM01]|uniref:hypothetical protein n=1 Tax=Bdellovibrio sp. KM01 TaxID=2748865 RepID=UPI0015EAD89A|nr:hypothetical protein [Bdellovibrio sp. KM01]QLY26590.1 hypothetical protein HW988_06115 [Bdellovibrio sp. KM01]